MITLGYIKQINDTNSNLFRVYLPIFDKAGVPASEDSSLFWANLAYNPGNLNAYMVDDCVIVGFLNNKKSNPVILGKLYVGDEVNATNYSFVNALKVVNNATLPEETVIGEISVPTLKNNILKINNAVDRLNEISDLQGRVETVEDSVDDLDDRMDSADDDIANLEETVGEITRFASKSITLSMTNASIYVRFNNFDSTDIGNKIYLYRTTRRGDKRFRHPENYDASSGPKFGYGSVASSVRDDIPNYPAIPEWMPNGGYIQTEWTITQSMLDAGGFYIYWTIDWLPLVTVRYDKTDEQDYWSEIYSTAYHGLRLNSIKFKFGLVDTSNHLITMSPTSIYFGRQKGNDLVEIIKTDSQDRTYIDSKYIYKTVK